ncbi:hypothetical protein IV38_GL001341 [Lactobacillus selangorensis]|uniref:6-phospho-beta-glucosidase n=2 Tax=Lactobacillus selangorensis TaxID=81857 RepID=A0A0R2G4W5_9LACO|nr:hypothetical protein IV38_GL001341 [Lactobacillus selangorensis]KRN31844.1 hypothetical protein IV40_GL001128 [Lactobacillus selangorensis]
MQTEGGWDADGKGKSVYDIRPATADTSDWKFANDNYHHYTEDFDLMAAEGMNCYRFQISWSRVNPTGDGAWNQAGIDYYSRFIDDLIKRGIQPMICLYHFDMPLALAEKYDGFMDRHVVDAFVRYGKKMIDEFGDRVKYWITFNEQNLYFMPGASVIAGSSKAPHTADTLYTIAHHIMLAHSQVVAYLHKTTHDQIGGMLAYAEFYPATCKPADVQAVRKTDEFLNRDLLDVFVHGHYSNEVLTYVKNHHINMDWQDGDEKILGATTSDFLAFSYYRSSTINSDLIPDDTLVNEWPNKGDQANPYLKTSEWGWQIDPTGFRDVIDKLYDQYGVPIFPIENGIGVREEYNGTQIQDDYRIDYHRAHIQAMEDAMFEDGVPVIGYLGWGLIDILSSHGDMNKRYGMVYVNRTNHDLKDMKRIPKKSYYWFEKVIKSNGADLGSDAK